MAYWDNLKASIAKLIKTNNNQEITGALLQSVLNSIISNVGANAVFAGVATPATAPGLPDGHVFYIAAQEGAYPNFGGSAEVKSGEVVIFEWAGSQWSSRVTGIAPSSVVSSAADAKKTAEAAQKSANSALTALKKFKNYSLVVINSYSAPSLDTVSKIFTIKAGTIIYTNTGHTISSDLSVSGTGFSYIIFSANEKSLKIAAANTSPTLEEGEGVLALVDFDSGVVEANFNYYLNGKFVLDRPISTGKGYEPHKSLMKDTINVLILGLDSDITTHVTELVQANGIAALKTNVAISASSSFTFMDNALSLKEAGFSDFYRPNYRTTSHNSYKTTINQTITSTIADSDLTSVIITSALNGSGDIELPIYRIQSIVTKIREINPGVSIGLIAPAVQHLSSQTESEALWKKQMANASVLVALKAVDYIIPVGTAVENLRKSTLASVSGTNNFVGANNRLAQGLARMCAALTIAQCIYGVRYNRKDCFAATSGSLKNLNISTDGNVAVTVSSFDVAKNAVSGALSDMYSARNCGNGVLPFGGRSNFYGGHCVLRNKVSGKFVYGVEGSQTKQRAWGDANMEPSKAIWKIVKADEGDNEFCIFNYGLAKYVTDIRTGEYTPNKAEAKKWKIDWRRKDGIAIMSANAADGYNSWNNYNGKGELIGYWYASDAGSVFDIQPWTYIDMAPASYTFISENTIRFRHVASNTYLTLSKTTPFVLRSGGEGTGIVVLSLYNTDASRNGIARTIASIAQGAPKAIGKNLNPVAISEYNTNRAGIEIDLNEDGTCFIRDVGTNKYLGGNIDPSEVAISFNETTKTQNCLWAMEGKEAPSSKLFT